MKNLTISLFLAFALSLSVGCHGQVPSTTHTVTLTVTPPSGCTASTCKYLISRVIVTGSTCPSATVGTYTPINTASELTGTTYVDSSVAGKTVCYVAQTDLAGAYSVPSNTVGPFAVPPNPTAPSIGGASSNTIAEIPKVAEQVASIEKSFLSGRVQ